MHYYYHVSLFLFRLDSDAKLQQQTETKNINVSLHTFGKVVMSLTASTSSQHVPYRDSKLTRILQGNSLHFNIVILFINFLQIP